MFSSTQLCGIRNNILFAIVMYLVASVGQAPFIRLFFENELQVKFVGFSLRGEMKYLRDLKMEF